MDIDFTLGHLAKFGLVNNFDGVFNSDDMVMAVLIDHLDQGGPGWWFLPQPAGPVINTIPCAHLVKLAQTGATCRCLQILGFPWG